MMAWKNCAIVLSEKSDEELAPYLDDLLRWLQDINWEGGTVICAGTAVLFKNCIFSILAKEGKRCLVG